MNNDPYRFPHYTSDDGGMIATEMMERLDELDPDYFKRKPHDQARVLLEALARMEVERDSLTAALSEARERETIARAAWAELSDQLDRTLAMFVDISTLSPDRYQRWKAYSSIRSEMDLIAPPPTDPPRHPHDALAAAEGEALGAAVPGVREQAEQRGLRGTLDGTVRIWYHDSGQIMSEGIVIERVPRIFPGLYREHYTNFISDWLCENARQIDGKAVRITIEVPDALATAPPTGSGGMEGE